MKTDGVPLQLQFRFSKLFTTDNWAGESVPIAPLTNAYFPLMVPPYHFDCCISCYYFLHLLCSQGVIISILVYTGVISSIFGTEADPRLVASKLQDFLICIEMFLAAVAHHYSFSYKPFVPHKEDREIADVLGCWDAFTAMWDVSDVHRDLREHIGVVGWCFTIDIYRFITTPFEVLYTQVFVRTDLVINVIIKL